MRLGISQKLNDGLTRELVWSTNLCEYEIAESWSVRSDLSDWERGGKD